MVGWDGENKVTVEIEDKDGMKIRVEVPGKPCVDARKYANDLADEVIKRMRDGRRFGQNSAFVTNPEQENR